MVYNMVQALPGPPSDESRPLRMPPDRMFCQGPLPDFEYGDSYRPRSVLDTLDDLDYWDCDDVEWSKLNFTDLTDLCTIYGNPAGNMGGMVKLIRGR